jgi:predicted methyltransferase
MSSSAYIGAILLSIAAACGGETPPSVPPPHAEVAPPPPPPQVTPTPEPSSSAAIAPPPVQKVPRPRAEPLSVLPAVEKVDAPLPPEARNLDAVVSVLVYHDTVWLGVDRDKMNKAAFNALKKGGEYVVIDHSAAAGHGTEDVKTLHRIEEGVVVAEVLRAGFEQGPSSNFLRNPEDGREWNDAPNAAAEKRGTSDRFALKFIRP